MITFIIQNRKSNNRIIPAQSFGYTCIEAIEYNNWYYGQKVYDYVFMHGGNDYFPMEYRDKNYIPIGSVEFVLKYLRLMGAGNVKPLNIPLELWHLVQRDLLFVKWSHGMRGKWFIKSSDIIKFDSNGLYDIKDAEDLKNITTKFGKCGFMTAYIDDVISEWRLFIFNKHIIGMKCYSGDEWVLPDKEYCEDIVKTYVKGAYTLDVMVYEDKLTSRNVSDIIELHDFFSCGLYGFEDFEYLPKMWMLAIKEFKTNNNYMIRGDS